jgi:hypothetical protein
VELAVTLEHPIDGAHRKWWRRRHGCADVGTWIAGRPAYQRSDGTAL